MVNRNEKGQFVKGSTGNPNGRPKGKRALTQLLEYAGDRAIAVAGPEGPRVARKELIAEMAWDLVINGEVELHDGNKIKLPPQEWLSLYKWIFTHIDGPARQEIGVEADGKLEIEVSYVEGGTRITKTAPEPADDQE